jgi:aryl-alcohol dehydrogenase-like predicted oxidoreductase
MLARALAGYPRDEIVIATKGGLRREGGGVARDASADWIRQGVDESLRALDMDYIDLYQLHWPDPQTPFQETADALAELVSEGKVLHVGVSNFDVAQMEAFSAILPVETLQPPYHLFRRDIEKEILPYAAAHNVGVLVYGPLAHGLLSGGLSEDTVFASGDWRAASPVFQGQAYHQNLAVVAELGGLANELGISLSQLAIAWALTNPGVDAAIVGTRNPVHVGQAVAAAEIDLEPAALKHIEEITARGVPVDGPSPEGMPRG